MAEVEWLDRHDGMNKEFVWEWYLCGIILGCIAYLIGII